jgi:hypothetical protein
MRELKIEVHCDYPEPCAEYVDESVPPIRATVPGKGEVEMDLCVRHLDEFSFFFVNARPATQLSSTPKLPTKTRRMGRPTTGTDSTLMCPRCDGGPYAHKDSLRGHLAKVHHLTHQEARAEVDELFSIAPPKRRRRRSSCPYCSRKITKNNMARHIESQHPGETP